MVRARLCKKNGFKGLGPGNKGTQVLNRVRGWHGCAVVEGQGLRSVSGVYEKFRFGGVEVHAVKARIDFKCSQDFLQLRMVKERRRVSSAYSRS